MGTPRADWVIISHLATALEELSRAESRLDDFHVKNQLADVMLELEALVTELEAEL